MDADLIPDVNLQEIYAVKKNPVIKRLKVLRAGGLDVIFL